MCGGACPVLDPFWSCFFEYDTPKIVNIKSKKIGCINRSIQLVIMAYIVGFAVVWQKGYQERSGVTSAVTTKVKGVIYTTTKNDSLYDRVWDPTDYVYPTYGGDNGGFFVTTNVVITKNQVRGLCHESPSVLDAWCRVDSDCVAGYSSQVGNGVFTGKCVTPPGTCEVRAWCPVESDNISLTSAPLLLQTYNSTVLIKNVVEFPKFGPYYKRRNVLECSNSSYLQTCVYNSVTDPFCPVFRLGDIVESAGENFTKLALLGGVMQIEITWDCDLDWDFMTYCVPLYSFERMDSEHTMISPGWNFRSAEYHAEDNRTLFKNYGIKFVVRVNGVGGKFSLVPLLINLGSGLALMGLATILCDVLVLHCLKYRNYYKDKKYLVISGPDSSAAGFDCLIESTNNIMDDNDSSS